MVVSPILFLRMHLTTRLNDLHSVLDHVSSFLWERLVLDTMLALTPATVITKPSTLTRDVSFLLSFEAIYLVIKQVKTTSYASQPQPRSCHTLIVSGLSSLSSIRNQRGHPHHLLDLFFVTKEF